MASSPGAADTPGLLTSVASRNSTPGRSNTGATSGPCLVVGLLKLGSNEAAGVPTSIARQKPANGESLFMTQPGHWVRPLVATQQSLISSTRAGILNTGKIAV